MRSGHFGAVTLLLSSERERSWLPEPLLIGIHDELARHGLHLSVARLPDEQLHNEQFVPKLLREWASDGLLINYLWQLPQYLNELIDRYRIPAIWLNVSLERDCVHPNDEAACEEMTGHLIEWGHRDIAFVCFAGGNAAKSHYSVQARRQGYERTMLAAGLAPRHLGNPEGLGLRELHQIPKTWNVQRLWCATVRMNRSRSLKRLSRWGFAFPTSYPSRLSVIAMCCQTFWAPRVWNSLK